MNNPNNATVNNNKEELTMNRNEIIRKYCTENQYPIQDLCPKVIQRWSYGDGFMTWTAATGKRKYVSSDNWRLYVPLRRFYDGFYMCWHPEFNAMEFARLDMKGGRGKEGEPRDWTYRDRSRFFVFLNDPSAYTEHGEQIINGRYYCKDLLDAMQGNSTLMYDHDSICSTVSQVDTDANTEYIAPWSAMLWYKTTWVTRSVSKKSKEITEIDLPDINPEDFNITLEDGAFCYISVINDYLVIRRFVRVDYYNRVSGHYEKGDFKEDARIFIDKKNSPRLMLREWRSKGKWRLTSSELHNYGYSGITNFPVIYENEEAKQWKTIRYMEGVVDLSTPEGMRNLLMVLRHPIIEKLIKSGYPTLARDLACDRQVKQNLKEYFSQEKEGKENIYKTLGVNKWLLFEAEHVDKEWRWDGMRLIKRVKELYNRFDISDLSKETIDMIMPLIKLLRNMSFNEVLCKGYREPLNDDDRKIILKLCRIQNNVRNKGTNIVSYYSDIHNLYRRINNKPQINLRKFDNFQDLENMHEALQQICNAEEMERRRLNSLADREREAELKKKFDKLQEDRIMRFEAESGKYCIRVPKALDDITLEGMNLGHCVGGYRDRHATGQTNILFLRKKDKEDTSFFTIEVNGNTVVQIHGKGNRWLGNEPEAIPFVWKWIQDRELNCPSHILLNLGAGYRAANESLSEDYLTKEVV